MLLLGENCKDCPYIKALDDKVKNIEGRLEKVETELIKQSIENAETKIYYEKIIDKIDDLKESVSLKMFSFETRLEKVEKAIEERKMGMWAKFSESPWSLKLLVYLLGGLAGLRLMGFDISSLLKF